MFFLVYSNSLLTDLPSLPLAPSRVSPTQQFQSCLENVNWLYHTLPQCPSVVSQCTYNNIQRCCCGFQDAGWLSDPISISLSLARPLWSHWPSCCSSGPLHLLFFLPWIPASLAPFHLLGLISKCHLFKATSPDHSCLKWPHSWSVSCNS